MKIATIVINHRALKNNLKLLRALTPNSKIIAIVKANAYGHSLIETAQTLFNVDAFGVARLTEALNLREVGIKKPILLLEGFFNSSELPIISKQHLQVVIHHEDQLKSIEKIKLHQPLTVWMKLDTGMHRLGVRLEDADIFYQRLLKSDNVRKPINIISHFSRADEPECNFTIKQLNIFNSFCSNKPGMRSIAASSGILLWPKSHLDYVRPGIILYGVSPLKNESCGSNFGFQPVMSFISSLISIRNHKAGEQVGYGGTWTSKFDTCLGVVAVGYGDGYPEAVPSGTPVFINGREVPIVGKVTMDMICIDLGKHASDKVGDLVILWGETLPIERIARLTNINVYELLTRFTSRIIRNFHN